MEINKGLALTSKKHGYTLIRALGNGGTSFVWEAKDETGRIWAVKILDPELTNEEERKARFEHEITFESSAKNKNIVKIVDYGPDYSFCVMPEYPKTFRDILQDKTLDPLTLLHYFQDVCQALSYAHQKGIIHRDIKPENIFYDPDKDCMLLADFGIAHFPDSAITTRGKRLANEKYRAPEQTKRSHFAIGTYTDIYAMGLILNELFTHGVPAGTDYPRISDYYPAFSMLDDLVASMIKFNPNEREKNIDWVILRLHYLLTKIRNETAGIRKALGAPAKGERAKRIRNQAILDLFFAKNEIEKGSDLSRFDFNYHCNVHYALAPAARDSYFLVELYTLLKDQFSYESGAVKLDDVFLDNPLTENGDNHDDDVAFSKTLHALHCYPYFNQLKKICVRLFYSLRDYHRDEVLASFEKTVSRFDNDWPILYLADKYLTLVKEGFDEAQLEDVCRILYAESSPEIEKAFSDKISPDQKDLTEKIAAIEHCFPSLTIEKEKRDAFVFLFKDTRSCRQLIDRCLAYQKDFSPHEATWFDVDDVCQKLAEKRPLGLFDLSHVVLPSLHLKIHD